MRLDRTGLAIGVAAAIALALLAGCKKEGATDALKETAAAALEKATDAKPGQADDAAGADQAKVGDFDISSVPLSTVSLGDFPYIRMPDGCEIRPSQPAYAKAPFWAGDAIRWVQGKTTVSYIVPRGDGDCGFANVVANLDSAIGAAGGVKVSEGKVSPEGYEAINEAGAMSRLEAGLQGLPNNPVATWVIRRVDRRIWIQIGADHTGSAFNFLLSEEGAPQITAGLLPASELKQQLDAAGKVALQVNFATDKTEILPDSQPQIEQVAELLKIDGALKLAVNGHTDNTGDAAHNQRLSEGRAASVVAAIVSKGIEASRLQAKGYGDSQPVADNGSEQGRAKNRRVELVKR